MPEFEVTPRLSSGVPWRASAGAQGVAALLAIIFAWAILCLLPDGSTAADAQTAAKPTARVEARSAELLAVGIVQNDRMVVHLSRPVDNAPVRDAALTVLLRGVLHPTTLDADGSYILQTPDLQLPGSAAVDFQVARGSVHEDVKGALDIAGTSDKSEDKNTARQLWWWVLNFAVCIGFLLLWSRRRKTVAAGDE